MYLIVGLGNPGKQYEHTRHNVGFRVLDLLTGGGGWEHKHKAEVLKLEDVILAKPQTFMNNSGEAVREILKYHPSAQLILIHDELDLPLGSIKIAKNSSSAGHNGVQSVIDSIGTKDFIRIRIGINNPNARTVGEGKTIPGEDYVLQKFSENEEQILKEVLNRTKSTVETIMTDGLEIAQSKYNG